MDLLAFAPNRLLKAPGNTTHFSVVWAAAKINFDTATQKGACSSTAELEYGKEATAAISLSNLLTANSPDALFLLLGVVFYKYADNKYYTLNNGANRLL